MTGDPLDRENMTDLRAQMIQGLNGNYVDADIAWQIIHRWDAQEEVARAARDLDSWQPSFKFALEQLHPQHRATVESLRAALARLDGPR